MPTEQEAKALELEAQARGSASSALAKIEAAMVEWESCAEKPRDLGARVEYLMRAQMLLTRWMQSSLIGPRDAMSVYKRLAKFADICVTLNNEGVV